jgi:hypothetical protein
MRKRVGGCCPIIGRELPPGDEAVLAQGKWHDTLQIAQGNVPLAGEPAPIGREAEIAFARLVGARAKSEKETNQDDELKSEF